MAETFRSIDAMRGVAALSVVVFHAGDLLPIPMASGYLAVDFFFLVSGFVIAHAYENRLVTGQLDFGTFVKRRLVRFYPLFALGLLLGLTREGLYFALGEPEYGVSDIVGSALLALLFLPTPWFPGLFPLNVPAWSLFFEIIVNIAYGLRVKALSDRVIVIAISMSAVGIVAATLIMGKLSGGDTWGTFWVGLARVAFSFPLGILIYRHRHRIPVGLSLATMWGSAALLVMFLAVSPGSLRAVYDLAFVGLASPLLLALAFRNEPSGSVSVAAAAYFGTISYAIYAIHYPLLWLARGAAQLIDMPPIVFGLPFLLGLLIVCPILDRYYDSPMRAWLTRAATPKARIISG